MKVRSFVAQQSCGKDNGKAPKISLARVEPPKTYSNPRTAVYRNEIKPGTRADAHRLPICVAVTLNGPPCLAGLKAINPLKHFKKCHVTAAHATAGPSQELSMTAWACGPISGGAGIS